MIRWRTAAVGLALALTLPGCGEDAEAPDASMGTLLTGVNAGYYGPGPSGARVTDEVVSGPVAVWAAGTAPADAVPWPRPAGEPLHVLESGPGRRASVTLKPGIYTIARTDGSCAHGVEIRAGETVTDDLRFGTLYCISS